MNRGGAGRWDGQYAKNMNNGDNTHKSYNNQSWIQNNQNSSQRNYTTNQNHINSGGASVNSSCSSPIHADSTTEMNNSVKKSNSRIQSIDANEAKSRNAYRILLDRIRKHTAYLSYEKLFEYASKGGLDVVLSRELKAISKGLVHVDRCETIMEILPSFTNELQRQPQDVIDMLSYALGNNIDCENNLLTNTKMEESTHYKHLENGSKLAIMKQEPAAPSIDHEQWIHSEKHGRPEQPQNNYKVKVNEKLVEVEGHFMDGREIEKDDDGPAITLIPIPGELPFDLGRVPAKVRGKYQITELEARFGREYKGPVEVIPARAEREWCRFIDWDPSQIVKTENDVDRNGSNDEAFVIYKEDVAKRRKRKFNWPFVSNNMNIRKRQRRKSQAKKVEKVRESPNNDTTNLLTTIQTCQTEMQQKITELEKRVASLEDENRKLHEQIRSAAAAKPKESPTNPSNTETSVKTQITPEKPPKTIRIIENVENVDKKNPLFESANPTEHSPQVYKEHEVGKSMFVEDEMELAAMPHVDMTLNSRTMGTTTSTAMGPFESSSSASTSSDDTAPLTSPEPNKHVEENSPNSSIAQSPVEIEGYIEMEDPDGPLYFTGWENAIQAVKVINFLDNEVVVAGNDHGMLYYYNMSDAQLIHSAEVAKEAITSILYLTILDRLMLFIGSLDTNLYLVDYSEKHPCWLIEIGTPINCMDTAWDCVFVGSTHGDLLGYQFDFSTELTTNNIIRLFHIGMDREGQEVSFVKATTDEAGKRILLVAAPNSTVCILDANTGLLLRQIGDNALKAPIDTLVLHNNHLYCGTSRNIVVYNFRDGKYLFSHKETDGQTICCMKMIEHFLFVVGSNGNIHMYDTNSGKVHASIMASGSEEVFLCMDTTDTKFISATQQKFQCTPLPFLTCVSLNSS